jgi:GT2 family glycosyltransferase
VLNGDWGLALGNARLSVVIPCFNSGALLTTCLQALMGQTMPLEGFEVIVVDDGSTDGTAALVQSLALPASFRYIRQPNRGAAAARNRGAIESMGDVLLFLDADVLPDDILLQEHLDSHSRYNRALVVGPTRAIADQALGPFHAVMGEALFACNYGDRERQIGFQQVLSRNLSLPRGLFHEVGRFDEDFPRSGFEDIEFAYRALRLGCNLVYNPKASGDHQHSGTLQEVGQHMQSYQMSAAMLLAKHPEICGQIRHLQDKEPVCWTRDSFRLIARKLVRQALSLGPAVWLTERVIAVLERWHPSPSVLRWLYWQILGSYLLAGYREGLARYPGPVELSLGAALNGEDW